MMTTQAKPTRFIPAMETSEGAGFPVQRMIGTTALSNFEPFMLLDQISGDNPDDYIAGFPSHPHRGFNTFTYMIDGDMEHKDSMGNTGSFMGSPYSPAIIMISMSFSGIYNGEIKQAIGWNNGRS